MSSTYRFLCLSHQPALVLDVWETTNRDQVVGLAERRDAAPELAAHHGCRLLVGRYSYPLVEVYNPVTRRWLEADMLRLLVEASAADLSAAVLAPFIRQGWNAETLSRLRPHLMDDDA